MINTWALFFPFCKIALKGGGRGCTSTSATVNISFLYFVIENSKLQVEVFAAK